MKYYPKVMGERVYLSPVCPDDADTYTRWLNDAAVTDGLGNTAKLIGLPAERKALEDMALDGHHFAIVRKADDVLLGSISFNEMDPIHRFASCGLFIGEAENRGKGYGAEALRLLLGYGFGTLNLNNVMLRVFAFNKQAIACYEKVGFKPIGARRQGIFLNGAYHDVLHMDILAEEFAQLPARAD